MRHDLLSQINDSPIHHHTMAQITCTRWTKPVATNLPQGGYVRWPIRDIERKTIISFVQNIISFVPLNISFVRNINSYKRNIISYERNNTFSFSVPYGPPYSYAWYIGDRFLFIAVLDVDTSITKSKHNKHQHNILKWKVWKVTTKTYSSMQNVDSKNTISFLGFKCLTP